MSVTTAEAASAKYGLLTVLLGATLLGFAAVFVKWALIGGATPVTVGLYRMVFALPGILLLACRCGRGNVQGIAWALFAGLAFAGDLTLWHALMNDTSAANATFIVCGLTPVWVALYSVLLRHLRYRRSGWFGQLLGISGAGLLAFARGARVGSGRGELLAILASFCYAVFTLTISRSRRTISARQALLWMSVGSLVAFCGVEWFTADRLGGYSARGWLGLLGLGLVIQLLAWLVINRALGQVSAALGTLGLSFQQVATPAFAALFLHEALKPLGLIGGGLIVVGIYLVATGEAKPSQLN